jgi:hypothetical protein
MTRSFSLTDTTTTSNYILVALLILVGATALFVGILAALRSEAATVSFIGRGIVKSGGETDHITISWTVVPEDMQHLLGVHSDVTTSAANLYKWEVENTAITIEPRGSLPLPGL